jgi:hypothetical protein
MATTARAATTARTSPGGVMGTRTMIIPGQRATAASRQALGVENSGGRASDAAPEP